MNDWMWQDTNGSGYWYNTRTGERRWAGKGTKPGNPTNILISKYYLVSADERKYWGHPFDTVRDGDNYVIQHDLGRRGYCALPGKDVVRMRGKGLISKLGGEDNLGNPGNPKVTSYKMTWGTCARCGLRPAIYMPLRFCEECHREFSQLGGEPGSEDRRRCYEEWMARGKSGSPGNNDKWLIYNPKGGELWSNEMGWVLGIENATKFSDEERRTLNLPLEGAWIKLEHFKEQMGNPGNPRKSRAPWSKKGVVIRPEMYLQSIIQKENEYFKTYGGPTEADFSINDIQREKIQAFYQQHPNTHVGKINRTERVGSPIEKYTSQKVFNFQYDFIIPQHDPELERLLLEREQATYTGTKEDTVRLDKIYVRVKQLGGNYLYWA